MGKVLEIVNKETDELPKTGISSSSLIITIGITVILMGLGIFIGMKRNFNI